MNVSWKGRCGWSGPLIDQPQPLWHGGSHRPQSRVPTMSGMQSAMMASKMRREVGVSPHMTKQKSATRMA